MSYIVPSINPHTTNRLFCQEKNIIYHKIVASRAIIDPPLKSLMKSEKNIKSFRVTPIAIAVSVNWAVGGSLSKKGKATES